VKPRKKRNQVSNESKKKKDGEQEGKPDLPLARTPELPSTTSPESSRGRWGLEKTEEEGEEGRKATKQGEGE
jgi:hypothetical protein